MSLAAYPEFRTVDGRPSPDLFHDAVDDARPAIRGVLRTTLTLRHAGTRAVQIGYELVGPADAPVVLAAGGISAHRHVVASDTFPEPGWWQTQSGVGLDTTRVRLLAIDWLGADGELDAPIDSADQADAIAAVLDSLDIDTLAAFVGSSYGAMVGLQFAARYPQRLGRLVAISGAHRSHPYASAWRALQRQAVALGQLQCDASQGLALARQLAMLSYRTPTEFAERFDPDWQQPFVAVFGEIIGVQIANAARAALRQMRSTGASLAQNAAEFVTEESRDVVGRAELNAFHDDVDGLRDDVDRLQAKVDRLRGDRP